MRRQTTIARHSLAGLEAALGENVAAGLLEVWGLDEHGQPLYKVTPKGEARARALLQGEPVPADGDSE